VATRKNSNSNNHLEEAMALLIRNQAAFVEQVARNDQERLKLQSNHEQLERETKEQFARVEERLARIETILLQLPKAIKKEIGFKHRP
jgi:hypothetical protein